MPLIKSASINENYAAQIIVVKNIRPVPNSDFLKQFTYQGMNIITTSAQEGDKVVYFPVECRLSDQLLKANNLFRKKERNADPEQAGFFEDNGRVRAIKLRGAYSEGFILPLQGLVDAYPELIRLPELEGSDIGKPFDTVGIVGKQETFVKKYVVDKQIKDSSSPKNGGNRKVIRESRLVDDQFKLHHDTPKLAAAIGSIPPHAFITITNKLHGTSFVSSNVLVKRKLSLIERIAKFFGASVKETEYGNVYSSRKVVKNEHFSGPKETHFYKEDIWGVVNNHLKDGLLKGETVYGEIVGYLSDSGMIQKGYDYGCAIGQHKVYIYRITHTNEDGKVIELRHDQIRERAEQLGVNVVPILWKGQLHSYYKAAQHKKDIEAGNPGNTGNYTVEPEYVLEMLKEDWANGSKCDMCVNKVPAEGMCLTVEDGLKPRTYKLKSSAFLQHETKELDLGETNIEDGQ